MASSEKTIRIGTRGSRLAVCQADWIKARLMETAPDRTYDLSIIKTQGDTILDKPLAKIGGKGLFVKEIEEALLRKDIDLAVHSMKDMPGEIPEGLAIGAVPIRETPYDALLSANGEKFSELPTGARVGTSSLRRASQLRHVRPDIHIVPLRGNLNTRLSKLESEELDAIILAAAGLSRLGLAHLITEQLDKQIMLPAVAQGALAVQIRTGEARIQPLVEALNHSRSLTAITAERAFLKRLEGGCEVPMAGMAQITGENLTLEGMVADVPGETVIMDSISGASAAAGELGRTLADRLLASGAREILESFKTAGD